MALKIKILGPGCINCYRVEESAVEALRRLSEEEPELEATLQHVTDFKEIMKYPILATPGLVVNEELVCAGRIPRLDEIIGWMREALNDTTG
ncbi:MAG: thioredoxin family protein [Anaerolineae bacterium]|jgi:small redox-active disulfide protein 2